MWAVRGAVHYQYTLTREAMEAQLQWSQMRLQHFSL